MAEKALVLFGLEADAILAVAANFTGGRMFQDLLKTWFEWSRDMGYAGVFLMMALESTIVPIPSEIIMPPAGFWAAQGRMSLWGVILAGGMGSTFGSALCYWFSRTLGRTVLERYGKYMLLPPERLELAERWLAEYALGGVFFSRLLPVVRHLIGFPAGLLRVPFWPFAGVTFVGSTLWCGILAVLGSETIGKQPRLLEDPAALMQAVKGNLHWFLLVAVGLLAGWMFVKWFGGRGKAAA